jgi:hypothetical protein
MRKIIPVVVGMIVASVIMEIYRHKLSDLIHQMMIGLVPLV